MSRRVVLGVLALIILLNAFVIGYVLIDRMRDDGDGDEQKQEEQATTTSEEEEDTQAEETEETEEATTNDTQESTEGETVNETTGSVPEDGNYTENEKELNVSAIEKSETNRDLMNELGKWIATNYAPDDTTEPGVIGEKFSNSTKMKLAIYQTAARH